MDPLQQMQQPQQPQPQDGKAVKLATPEQKQQLLDMIEATRGKLGEFNSTSFAVDNQMEMDKNDALRQVFTVLQSAGVDLNDPKSISDFLNKLRIQNPQMSQIFEESLNTLLGGGVQEPIQEDMQQSMPQGMPPQM